MISKFFFRKLLVPAAKTKLTPVIFQKPKFTPVRFQHDKSSESVEARAEAEPPLDPEAPEIPPGLPEYKKMDEGYLNPKHRVELEKFKEKLMKKTPDRVYKAYMEKMERINRETDD